ncbi:MAG: glycosyltransferase family 4 protein [Chitinophagaceae bacterium]|nr:glycosyltransferase family 4 protein [Chitinophagaceae bacterium]
MSRDANKRIRLLVDAHTFDGEYQGTRTFIHEIYRRLALSPELELYIAAYDPVRLEQDFPVGRIRFLKFRSRSSVFRLLVELPLLIRKHRIDYAHFQYMVPPLRNCRFIVTMHDVLFLDYPREFSLFYRLYKTWLYRHGAKKASILTVNSDFSEASVRRHLGIRTPIHFTPMAVDQRYFQHYDKNEVRQIFRSRYGFDRFVLYVSRIEPRKNHALLLQAYLELELYKKGIRLVLLGHRSLPAPEFDRLLAGLSKEIRSFILTDHAVSDAELLLFYQAASLFVYPSKAEGFGIPPLEAAAARIPVICSNSSAMKEFDFFGDRHIDPADHTGFRNAIAAALEQEPDNDRLAAIAETIRQRYSWDRSAATLQQLVLNDAEATGNPR